MSRTMKKRSAKAGLPPGALVYVGDPRTKTSRITVMDYTADTVRETTVQDASQCGQFESADSVTWMNIDELSEPGIVAGLGASLHFHPLMQEDILNTDQRTKLEDHGDHLYIVLKMLDWDAQRDAMDVEQLSLVLGANYVLSFQERAGDFFDPLRNRIRQNAGRVRKLGPDYLAYCLLDLTLDHYFIVLEKLGERIERVEDAVMTRPRRETLSEIHALKRELVYMRKAVWRRDLPDAACRHPVDLSVHPEQSHQHDHEGSGGVLGSIHAAHLRHRDLRDELPQHAAARVGMGISRDGRRHARDGRPAGSLLRAQTLGLSGVGAAPAPPLRQPCRHGIHSRRDRQDSRTVWIFRTRVPGA